jgi:bifunctional DNA-binding transcriptional regulator/antitoxin component of YhaV-PrlF toxin-antitoxin module
MVWKPTVEFEAEVVVSGHPTPWHFLSVPRKTVAPLEFTGNLRRVVCSLNGGEPFQCSLFPSKGNYYITLSKPLRIKLGLKVGDKIRVGLIKDESKYGMPMPEEFAEVLRQDAQGDKLFNDLTPGNQRLILKLIVAVADVDKRIYRSLLTMEHLKQRDGKFNWHELNEAFKQPSVDGDFRES